jgi:hypothetical protein
MAYNMGLLFGALGMGSLCGLLPLIFGMRKGQQSLGLAGFVVCVFCGLVLGVLLALPAAIVFTLIIFSKARPA